MASTNKFFGNFHDKNSITLTKKFFHKKKIKKNLSSLNEILKLLVCKKIALKTCSVLILYFLYITFITTKEYEKSGFVS